ncbi:MAG: aminoacyl-tRNA hydrolase [Spirochaetales bacterium]|nr:aminoacyl-tRNA hydrolase [Spirochaetales bacterium]
MKVIALLGNPGRQYQNTRHNYPWLVADSMSWLSSGWNEKFKGLYQDLRFDDERLIFLKPMTQMNLSGQSVQAAMAFYKIMARDLLVAHDDIELPFGQAAFKSGGGHGGHNGLRSVIELLGSSDFYRLRLGIGRPLHGPVASHVLGRFSSEEEAVLPRYLELYGAFLHKLRDSDLKSFSAEYSKINLDTPL